MTAPAPPLLAVRDLAIGFSIDGGQNIVRAVRGIDLDIHEGEIVGLVGESGSGKSATGLALIGLHDNRAEIQGSIRLEGRELRGLDEAGWNGVRGRQIGTIFQDPMASLNPLRSIGAQLMQTLRRNGSTDARGRALELLASVGLPDGTSLLAAHPHTLSGGMNQRVMIALALAGNPKILIADEPTTALDVVIQARILKLLRRQARERGLSVLLITHDLGVVADTCDRVAVMYGGRIVETGPVDAVLKAPLHRYTAALVDALPDGEDTVARLADIPGDPVDARGTFSGCAFAARCLAAAEECRVKPPELVFHPGRDGHAAACLRPPSAKDRTAAAQPVRRFQGTVVMKAEAITVQYGGRFQLLWRKSPRSPALTDASFELHAGETLGIVGESGSGKSTLGRVLTGALAPTGGKATFEGTAIPLLASRKGPAFTRRVQMIFQNPMLALDPRVAVGEQIAEPLAVHRLGTAAERRRLAEETAGLVGLSPELLARVPQALSGGQRQRVVIARALILKPDILVCDEPVAALDLSVQAQVVNLLADLRDHLGLTLVFISHDLRVLRHLADRIAVMHRGRIVELADAGTLFQNPAHPYSRVLIDAAPGRGMRLADDGVDDQTEAAPSAETGEEGCAFLPRCNRADAACRTEHPPLARVGPAHWAACHTPLVTQSVPGMKGMMEKVVAPC